MSNLIDEVGLRVNAIQKKSSHTIRYKFEVCPIDNLVIDCKEKGKTNFILYRYNTNQSKIHDLLYDFLYVEAENGFANLLKIGKFAGSEIESEVEQKTYFFDKNFKVNNAIIESAKEKGGKMFDYEKDDIATINLGQDLLSFPLVHKFRFEMIDQKVKVSELIKV
jgi:hypothetical protein